jgi:hypothetical protein
MPFASRYKKLAAMSALGLLCLLAVIVLGFYDSAVQIAAPPGNGSVFGSVLSSSSSSSSRSSSNVRINSGWSTSSTAGGSSDAGAMYLDSSVTLAATPTPAPPSGGGSGVGGGDDAPSSIFGVAIFPTWSEFNLAHLPATVSIFVFAFSAHGIFPDLEVGNRREEERRGVCVFVCGVLLAGLRCIFRGR